MTTAVSLDELPAMRSDDECPIVNGQYSIVPQGEKKAVLHQRVTNFIKPLKDTYLLELRDQRMVALGLVANPGLFALAAAAHPDDRKGLNDICRKAQVAAKSDDRANYGTALHTMTERVDRGEDPDSFPEPFRTDLRAYAAARDAAGFEMLEIERYVVLPGFKVAGRSDRVIGFGSQPKIGDLKTGSLDFGIGDIAAQLACYANAATFYDPQSRTHQPMPDIDKDTGIIIHLPAGEGRCDIWFVDIAAGWEAIQHADWIRQWRRRNDLAERWDDHSPIAQPDVRRSRLLQRARQLPDEGRKLLAANWPAGVPGLLGDHAHTDEELNLIAMAISITEDRIQAPFATPDPADTNKGTR